jgi:hypothetical protein
MYAKVREHGAPVQGAKAWWEAGKGEDEMTAPPKRKSAHLGDRYRGMEPWVIRDSGFAA